MGLKVKPNNGVAAETFPYVTNIAVKLFNKVQMLDVPITKKAMKKAAGILDDWFQFEGAESVCWINHEDDWQNIDVYKDRVAVLVTREMWESGGSEYVIDSDDSLSRTFIHTNKVIAQTWFRLKGVYINTLRLDIIPHYGCKTDSIVEVSYRTGGEHQISLSPSLLGRIRTILSSETGNNARRIKITLTAKPFGVMDIQHHAYYDVGKATTK